MAGGKRFGRSFGQTDRSRRDPREPIDFTIKRNWFPFRRVAVWIGFGETILPRADLPKRDARDLVQESLSEAFVSLKETADARISVELKRICRRRHRRENARTISLERPEHRQQDRNFVPDANGGRPRCGDVRPDQWNAMELAKSRAAPQKSLIVIFQLARRYRATSSTRFRANLTLFRDRELRPVAKSCSEPVSRKSDGARTGFSGCSGFRSSDGDISSRVDVGT